MKAASFILMLVAVGLIIPTAIMVFDKRAMDMIPFLAIQVVCFCVNAVLFLRH